MIMRELDVLDLLDTQINQVLAERDALVMTEAKAGPGRAIVASLLTPKGIGPGFAGVLWSEGLFRYLHNRSSCEPFVKREAAPSAGRPAPW